MSYYKKYITPYLKFFILGPICMIVEVIGEVLLPKMTSLIINEGIANHNIPYIVTVGLLMIGIAILMALGGIGGAYFAAHAAMSFGADLRLDIFKKIQTFSFKNIDDFSTGSLVTRLTNDITQIQNIITMILRMCLRSPGMLIGALFMALNMNAKLALVIIVIIPVLAASISFIIYHAFPKFQGMQQKLDALNNMIQESLMNIRVIKSFVRDDFEGQKFDDRNEDLRNATLSAMHWAIFTMPVMTLCMNVATIAVVWFGGNMIIGGTMLVGDLTAFITYITQILMSLMMFSMIFLNLSRALVSFKRVREVLECEVDLNDDNAGQKERLVENGDIEFKNVSFRYYK
ncbi:MAG: ABC transporter permease, partial [Lachnospiraceae bacterium]